MKSGRGRGGERRERRERHLRRSKSSGRGGAARVEGTGGARHAPGTRDKRAERGRPRPGAAEARGNHGPRSADEELWLLTVPGRPAGQLCRRRAAALRSREDRDNPRRLGKCARRVLFFATVRKGRISRRKTRGPRKKDRERVREEPRRRRERKRERQRGEGVGGTGLRGVRGPLSGWFRKEERERERKNF